MKFCLTSQSTLDTFSVLMKSSHREREAGGEVDSKKVDPGTQIDSGRLEPAMTLQRYFCTTSEVNSCLFNPEIYISETKSRSSPARV
jgi:hypothetical protein